MQNIVHENAYLLYKRLKTNLNGKEIQILCGYFKQLQIIFA
jgi:hypothetical protein